MSPSNNVFSVFSFLSFILVCIPLPWHLQAWNTGTCLFIGWIALASLNYFINSIIWNGNATNWAPVWCDISSRIIVATVVAIPASSLCINRRLYRIACVQSVTTSRGEKRRKVMVDLAIGIGLPLLSIPLQYISEGHRFDIFEDFGCNSATYITPVAFPLVFAPPIIISLISASYAYRSLLAFSKRRMEFKAMLSNSTLNLSTDRYFRLMVLASTEILVGVPFQLLGIVFNVTLKQVHPWISWEDTHWGFSRVDQYPASLWRADSRVVLSLEASRWLVVFSGFVFFAFFGFAEEARKNYRATYTWVAGRLGLSIKSQNGGSSFGGSNGLSSQGWRGSNKNGPTGSNGTAKPTPIFVKREVLRKHDSLDSLSDMSSIGPTSIYSQSADGDFALTNTPSPAGVLPENTEDAPFGSLAKYPSGSKADLNELEVIVVQPAMLSPQFVKSSPPSTPPAMRARPESFPVSIGPSSFLDLSTTMARESVLGGTEADDRV